MEEKVFTVVMNEEELCLFSEFLEQREYSIKSNKSSVPFSTRRRLVRRRQMINNLSSSSSISRPGQEYIPSSIFEKYMSKDEG